MGPVQEEEGRPSLTLQTGHPGGEQGRQELPYAGRRRSTTGEQAGRRDPGASRRRPVSRWSTSPISLSLRDGCTEARGEASRNAHKVFLVPRRGSPSRGGRSSASPITTAPAQNLLLRTENHQEISFDRPLAARVRLREMPGRRLARIRQGLPAPRQVSLRRSDTIQRLERGLSAERAIADGR